MAVTEIEVLITSLKAAGIAVELWEPPQTES